MPGTGVVGVLSQGAKSRSSSFRQMHRQHLDNIDIKISNSIYINITTNTNIDNNIININNICTKNTQTTSA